MIKKYIIKTKTFIYKNFLTLVLFLSFVSTSQAQIYQHWLSTYNGLADSTDRGMAMDMDNSGNIYSGGTSYNIFGNQDYKLIKYNPQGDTAWTRSYESPGNGKDEIHAVKTDGAGNIIVTGIADSNIVSIKYNSNGDLLWIKTFDGIGKGQDSPNSIKIDGNDNIYICGYTDQMAGIDTNYNYITIKYDPSGNLVWAKTYNGTGNGNDRAYDLVTDVSGNVYVTGYSLNNFGRDQYTTIKYDLNGALQWTAVFDRKKGTNKATSIAINSSGIYVTGKSSNGKDFDYATVGYLPNGSFQWSAIYDGGNKDEARKIGLDNFGNVYITGSSKILSGLFDNCATIKYDALGNEQWVSVYDGTDQLDDDARCMKVTGNGNVYIGGESNAYADSSNCMLIKYNTLGNQIWDAIYHGTGGRSDGIRDLCVTQSGDIYVCGFSDGGATRKDILTMKYSPTPMALEEITENNGSMNIYPNPFDNNAILSFVKDMFLPSSKISLEIFNSLGVCVRSINDIKENKIYIQKDELPSGIYLYQLHSDKNEVESGKFIIN